MRKDRVDRPRHDGMYVPPVEKDKGEKEPYRQLPPGKENGMLAATFFSYLERLFSAFAGGKNFGGRLVSKLAISDDLLAFQKVLLKLAQEDLSKSPAFATELGESFSRLLDGEQALAIMEKKGGKKRAKYRELLDALRHYPEGSEHPLAFYLLEHAGKDWLPFPFMEMLADLHNEHQSQPDTSTLKKWDHLISEVATSLKKIDLPKH